MAKTKEKNLHEETNYSLASLNKGEHETGKVQEWPREDHLADLEYRFQQ